MLAFKEDWEEAKERFLLWWGHEYFGRCAMAVTAPKKKPPHLPRPPAPENPQQRWYDLDWNSRNIGPDMFREVFLPVIQRQTEFLDYTVYHVDGIEAFKHVDALCELPRLQAIQILPGAGKPSPLHYVDTLRKVQAAGKNLHISIAADEVQHALAQLSARGLFIDTSARSEDEARNLLRMAERWSVDRG